MSFAIVTNQVQVLSATRKCRGTRVFATHNIFSAAESEVPDMEKRKTMNLLLLGAVGLPGFPLASGFASFVRALAFLRTSPSTLTPSSQFVPHR